MVWTVAFVVLAAVVHERATKTQRAPLFWGACARDLRHALAETFATQLREEATVSIEGDISVDIRHSAKLWRRLDTFRCVTEITVLVFQGR